MGVEFGLCQGWDPVTCLPLAKMMNKDNVQSQLSLGLKRFPFQAAIPSTPRQEAQQKQGYAKKTGHPTFFTRKPSIIFYFPLSFLRGSCYCQTYSLILSRGRKKRRAERREASPEVGRADRLGEVGASEGPVWGA